MDEVTRSVEMFRCARCKKVSRVDGRKTFLSETWPADFTDTDGKSTTHEHVTYHCEYDLCWKCSGDLSKWVDAGVANA